MTSDAQPLLSVRNLATGYGDLRVVWDVSLDVYAGQVTALLGRNGAGKTTTLRAVAGLNAVHEGSIDFVGSDLTRLPAHRRVAAGVSYVPEGKRVFRHQTVEENLILGGYSLGHRRSSLQRKVQDAYDLFPILRDKRSDRAGSLSGGQQQMVVIAQALMAQPQILMLDEPSGGLAPAIVGEVMARVGEMAERGIGVVLVEQAVEVALDLADHVVVLDIGRVVLSSRADELDDVSKITDAYVGR